jgi:hypothetical protein
VVFQGDFAVLIDAPGQDDVAGDFVARFGNTLVEQARQAVDAAVGYVYIDPCSG